MKPLKKRDSWGSRLGIIMAVASSAYSALDYFLFYKGFLKKGIKVIKKGCISYLLFICLLMHISGCTPLIVGVAAGGVAMYSASKDTIEGATDKSYDRLWNAAIEVSKLRGTIRQQDSNRGYIELDADSTKVHIRLIRLTRATTRLRISARRYHLPNLSLAQDIFVKITEMTR